MINVILKVGSHNRRGLQTCPQNVLLRVAYPYVRNDVTVEKPQHVCWKQPHHVIDDRFFYPSRDPHFITFCFV